MRNLLPVSYIILFLLLAGAVGMYRYGDDLAIEWLKDLSLNVGTEIFGILLTVFLIDAVIRWKEERERYRVRKVAFQQLRIPLLHQLHVLHGMYKASVTFPPENKPNAVRDLFCDSYFVQIAFLDFSKPAPLSSSVPLQWFDYLKIETKKFKAALRRTIDKYAVFLEGDSVELLEKLVNSDFLSLLEQAPAIREVHNEKNFKRHYNLLGGQGMAELAREYTSCFSELIDLYNMAVPVDQELVAEADLWRNDIAPQFGSARAPS